MSLGISVKATRRLQAVSAFLSFLVVVAPTLCSAGTWYVSEDDGETCRKVETNKRPYPLGRNLTFEELMKNTSGAPQRKPEPWAMSQKELNMHEQIQAELDRLLVTNPDLDEPLPVIASRMKVDASYIERVFILGDVVRNCIREGRLATASTVPPARAPARPTKALYKVLDTAVSDTPIKTQVELRLLVPNDIASGELDSLLREAWNEQKARSGFRHHTHPTVIAIFAYLSEDDYRRGSAWVGRLMWRESDAGNPLIDNLRR